MPRFSTDFFGHTEGQLAFLALLAAVIAAVLLFS